MLRQGIFVYHLLVAVNVIVLQGLRTPDATKMLLEQQKLSENLCKPTPFPKVKGPKSLKAKIAIVGAGPAGIHMGYKLKKAGYTNITVFERKHHIGGKSTTVFHRGTPQEMGTVYTQPDYTEIYELVREFQSGDILPMPSPTIWVNGHNSDSVPLAFPENTLRVMADLHPGMTNTTDMIMYFTRAVRKYAGLHNALFGQYDGELMPRPCCKVLAQVNMTFLEFLKKHDIEILKAPFLTALTAQGYGHLDEISALYGMMWVTPNFLLKIITPASKEEKKVKILSKGFQGLWEDIAKQSNLNVKLHSPIQKIIRLKHGGGFYVKYWSCGRLHGDIFDFIIVSPTMKLMSNIMEFEPEAEEMFMKTFNFYYTTTLADTSYSRNRSPSPQDYYESNIINKVDNSVWVQRDSYAALNYIIGENYTSGSLPDGPDGQFIQTSVYYQFSKMKPNRYLLKRMLKNHINNVQKAELLQIQTSLIWNYFPRYSVSDMASGILWEIFNVQGEHGVWYIGSSVSFESVKSVVEYNNLLLRQFL